MVDECDPAAESQSGSACHCPSCRAVATRTAVSPGTTLQCPACQTVFSTTAVSQPDLDLDATIDPASRTGSSPPPSVPIAPGDSGEPWSAELLARYEVVRLLGKGGMGSVYLARDRNLGRTVALKILKAADPGMRKGFVREARALALLSHPNTLVVHDCGEAGDQPYLVCEYIDGETLADLIRRTGPAALDRALELIDALLTALGLIGGGPVGPVAGPDGGGPVGATDTRRICLLSGHESDASAWKTRVYESHHMVIFMRKSERLWKAKVGHSVAKSPNSADLAGGIRRIPTGPRMALRSQGGPTWPRE